MTLGGLEGVGAAGGVEVVVVVDVEVEVSEVKVDVVQVAVEVLVSVTASVARAVVVLVAVVTAPVLTGSVTVDGCGFRQLHALESAEAGRRRNFAVFTVGQLEVTPGARFTTAVPSPVTVAVTAVGSTSVVVRITVVPVVVILHAPYQSALSRATSTRLTYVTSRGRGGNRACLGRRLLDNRSQCAQVRGHGFDRQICPTEVVYLLHQGVKTWPGPGDPTDEVFERGRAGICGRCDNCTDTDNH